MNVTLGKRAVEEGPGVTTRIYFSDFFEVDAATIEAYGAFNVSLINDLPLFVDPFLLFDSEDDEYRQLHDAVIRYVIFLKEVSQESGLSQGLIDHWFRFPEVSQNWLGFSKVGNRGTGLGKEFAQALHVSLHQVFRDFGAETITQSSHLEKLCLMGRGVGRDHLSDFVTNLIKGYLLEYTQAFARQHLRPANVATFAVEKVMFDTATRRWRGARYDLPSLRGDYVLLTPKAILTKDEAWINRADLINNFEGIYTSLPDDQLRAQINDHFLRQLSEDAKEKERRDAAAATIERFPAVLDYYIKDKEDNAEEAHRVSNLKVLETQVQFVDNVRQLVDGHLTGTDFYELGNSFEESLRRLHFLKSVVEDQDGYRFFYMDGQPIKREADLQMMYRLTWFGTSFDVNREVNNGRGPVDFKVSKGSANKSLVEFKLASNSQIKRNLEYQVDVYEAANDTAQSIKAIMFFSEEEHEKVLRILRELKLEGRRDVVLIDACNDNKPSASKAG